MYSNYKLQNSQLQTFLFIILYVFSPHLVQIFCPGRRISQRSPFPVRHRRRIRQDLTQLVIIFGCRFFSFLVEDLLARGSRRAAAKNPVKRCLMTLIRRPWLKRGEIFFCSLEITSPIPPNFLCPNISISSFSKTISSLFKVAPSKTKTTE
jgi:hypothetical protein